MYDITTGTGDYISNGVVSHNCFARNTHTYSTSMRTGLRAEITSRSMRSSTCAAELARPTRGREQIAMGTKADPYQRAEGRYKLMRGILDALADLRNPFSILTKGR